MSYQVHSSPRPSLTLRLPWLPSRPESPYWHLLLPYRPPLWKLAKRSQRSLRPRSLRSSRSPTMQARLTANLRLPLAGPAVPTALLTHPSSPLPPAAMAIAPSSVCFLHKSSCSDTYPFMWHRVCWIRPNTEDRHRRAPGHRHERIVRAADILQCDIVY